MDQLTRCEVPNPDAQGRKRPTCDLEVRRAQRLHAGNIGLTTRVELTQGIAFEIPDANLAVSSSREQLAAIRRKVTAATIAMQFCQRRQFLACIRVPQNVVVSTGHK